MVGMKMPRALRRRCSGGNTLADGASQGQAPASAAAYGSALRERSFSTGLTDGLGSTSSRLKGTVSGGNRNSESAREAARGAARSNSAENTGRDWLSPYTSTAPAAERLSATKPCERLPAPLSRTAAWTAAAENVKLETRMPASVNNEI